MEMMTPNRLALAQQELATINRFDNGFVIPEEVKSCPKNNHYYLIGVRRKKSKSLTDQSFTGKLVCISINQYRKMQRQHNAGNYKNQNFSLLGGIWQMAVILHDPTIKPKKTAPKVKALSPKHKKAVNEMVEEGKTVEEMANALEIEVERIKAYLK